MKYIGSKLLLRMKLILLLMVGAVRTKKGPDNTEMVIMLGFLIPAVFCLGVVIYLYINQIGLYK